MGERCLAVTGRPRATSSGQILAQMCASDGSMSSLISGFKPMTTVCKSRHRKRANAFGLKTNDSEQWYDASQLSSHSEASGNSCSTFCAGASEWSRPSCRTRTGSAARQRPIQQIVQLGSEGVNRAKRDLDVLPISRGGEGDLLTSPSMTFSAMPKRRLRNVTS